MYIYDSITETFVEFYYRHLNTANYFTTSTLALPLNIVCMNIYLFVCLLYVIVRYLQRLGI